MQQTLKYLLLIIFSIAGWCNSYAQKKHNEGDAKYITKFPFKMYSGGVMVIAAKFENIEDSLHFILDTGSGGASLDSTTCADLGIITQPSDTVINGIGGKRKVDFVFNKSLRFPGLHIPDMNFHVNNYEVLTSVYGEKIDGIIGYTFFKRYIVKINFDSLHLEVLSPGKIKYPRKGTLFHPIFTNLPIMPVQIKDARKLTHHFYFDTGAGLAFLINERFAKDSNLFLKRRKPLLTQAEGMTGRLQMHITVIKKVKMGPYSFFKVPTFLYKDDNNVTGYPHLGGLIGNEILRRFNMTINYPKKEIHLVPNSRFRDEFDYAYTGLGLYMVDEKISVEDVIENSPAAEAGFQLGDIVISIGNNTSQNIQQYKNILQSANHNLKVIILRKNKLIELFLRPKSIL